MDVFCTCVNAVYICTFSQGKENVLIIGVSLYCSCLQFQAADRERAIIAEKETLSTKLKMMLVRTDSTKYLQLVDSF